MKTDMDRVSMACLQLKHHLRAGYGQARILPELDRVWPASEVLVACILLHTSILDRIETGKFVSYRV